MKWSHAGFTLVEILIALAMLAVLTAALAPTIVGHLGDARAARAVQDVRAIEQGVATWVQRTGATTYTTLSMTALVNAGALPASFNGANANPWGNTYGASGTATTYTVTVAQAPDAATRTALNGAFGTRATVNTPLTYPGDVTIQFTQ